MNKTCPKCAGNLSYDVELAGIKCWMCARVWYIKNAVPRYTQAPNLEELAGNLNLTQYDLDSSGDPPLRG
jgi:hypothetical protein